MNDEMMREAFEKWLAEEMQDDDPLKNKRGKYLDPETRFAWEVWQAAWNTRAQASAPKRDRPSSNPGGVECMGCGCIFVGDETHTLCGVCNANKQSSTQDRGEVACWRYLNAGGEVVTEWIDGTPPDKHFDICGNEILGGSVEVAYTRSNAKAGEVDDDMVQRYVDAVNIHLGNLTADEWAADYANVEESIKRVARIGLTAALSTHDKTKA